MIEKINVQCVTNLCITRYATVLNWTIGFHRPSISESRRT
jgi:hypothetical protein